MNKYIISGSLGHVSKPIVEGLVKAGKQVSVITSNNEKVGAIEALGAKAIVGSVTDTKFLKSALAGAEVVYAMIPPIWTTNDWRASQAEVADSFTKAIKENKVPYVVVLSSLGAHLPHGCGPVSGLREFEQSLNAITGLNVKYLRAAYFFNNFLNQINLIKTAGIMGGNFGSSELKQAFVHPDDIATAALEELLSLNFKGSSVRNVVSEFLTGPQVASTLSKAVGKEFPWVEFTDTDQFEGFIQGGLSKTHAEGYIEMGVCMRDGKMQEEVLANPPALGKSKVDAFAKEFAAAFKG